MEGCRLLLDVGHGSGWHLMNMAVVEAIQRREEARSHAEEALCIGQRTGSTFLIACAERTLGFLDLTLGRAEQAADRLLSLTTPGSAAFNNFMTPEAAPNAIEASIRAGRNQAAAERLETFRTWVVAAPTPGRLALLAQCEALLGIRDQDEAFGQALAAAQALSRRARPAMIVRPAAGNRENRPRP